MVQKIENNVGFFALLGMPISFITNQDIKLNIIKEVDWSEADAFACSATFQHDCYFLRRNLSIKTKLKVNENSFTTTQCDVFA